MRNVICKLACLLVLIGSTYVLPAWAEPEEKKPIIFQPVEDDKNTEEDLGDATKPRSLTPQMELEDHTLYITYACTNSTLTLCDSSGNTAYSIYIGEEEQTFEIPSSIKGHFHLYLVQDDKTYTAEITL